MAWHGMARRAVRRIPVLRGSARSLHEPIDFPSLPSLFAIQLCNQQPAENFSNTLSHFHAPRWPLLPSNLIPTSQLLRAPRAQQPTADLPRNKSAPSTSSSTSRRIVHHSAPRGPAANNGGTGPEFEVCNRDVLAVATVTDLWESD